MEKQTKVSKKEEKVKPLRKARSGRFQASVFPSKFGESCVLQRSFMKDGKWVNEKITLYPAELDNMLAVLNKVGGTSLVNKASQ